METPMTENIKAINILYLKGSKLDLALNQNVTKEPQDLGFNGSTVSDHY